MRRIERGWSSFVVGTGPNRLTTAPLTLKERVALLAGIVQALCHVVLVVRVRRLAKKLVRDGERQARGRTATLSEDNAVRVALADFVDRRGEIDKRSAEQQALIRLNITAVGVLAGVVVSERGHPHLLLLLPPISAALGMLWANHERMIHHIGDYIYDCVKPVVDPHRGGPLLHWEAAHDLYPEASAWQRARYALPVLIMFTGPPAAALTFVGAELALKEGPLIWWGWGLALLVTLYAAVLVATSGILKKAGSGTQRTRGDRGIGRLTGQVAAREAGPTAGDTQ